MTRLEQALTACVFIALLNACGGTPTKATNDSGPCDMQQVIGSCAARIDIVRGKAVVCNEQTPNATPACMNVSIDLTSAKGDGTTSRKFLLMPGQCRTTGTALASAAQSSCDAYAARTPIGGT